MNDYVSLLLGIGCAGIGGELFVRGAIGFASIARLPPGIIAATLAAFSTSSPEFFVSTQSALLGSPRLGLGDSLGSNVVNVALILGLSLAISGIRSPRDFLARDFPVALAVPALTGFMILDGLLSRWDGIVMLGLFCGWSAAVMRAAWNQRGAASGAAPGGIPPGRVVLYCILGAVSLIAAGRLVVQGARGIALSAGISEFIIGQTIVAVGTSLPELATTLIAKFKGHDEIGLGTLLGSNIFNGLFIVAAASIIHPIAISWREVSAALGFGLLVLIMAYPNRDGFIARGRGFALLAVYGCYLLILIRGNPGP